MVMLTTSKTTTSWMFAVLAYTSVTSRYMATVLASFWEPRWHCFCKGFCISLLQRNLIISPSKWVPIHPAEKTTLLVQKKADSTAIYLQKMMKRLETEIRRGYDNLVCLRSRDVRLSVNLLCLHRHNANNVKQRCFGPLHHASTAISYECTKSSRTLCTWGWREAVGYTIIPNDTTVKPYPPSV